MSTTIHHVQLQFPILPSTMLDQKQRSHRLRSTRKLQAILGTTQSFLDLDYEVGIMPKSPTLISPRTKAFRRKGQLFQSQSNSIFVSLDAQPGLYHLPLSPSSSSCSLSPNVESVTKVNYRRSGKSGETHAKGSESPQILAQPSLQQPASDIKSGILPIDQTNPLLSPVSPSFDMDTSTILPHPYHLMTDNEKRKKLAKLARTLGENVPPELVFRSPPLQRAATMSISRLRKSPSSHKQSRSIPLPVAESPAPQPQSTRRSEKCLEQQSRPRSVTLTTKQAMAMESAIAETRESMSLDHAISVDTDTKRHDALSLEWGKRREKDWSGEWNVKDMEYVAKALRGLKGR